MYIQLCATDIIATATVLEPVVVATAVEFSGWNSGSSANRTMKMEIWIYNK